VSNVAKITAREVLDSRGNPTVEVEVVADTGALGRAIVPSGASTGRHEALELRDGDQRRYRGKGVRHAVAHVTTEIAASLRGMALDDQAAIDRKLIALDGTSDKSRLGANAILGASLAVAHAAAAANAEELYVHLNRLWKRHLDPGEPSEPVLPLPMVNMISGGLHAGGNLDFQDFLMIPVGASSYRMALEMAVATYRSLAEVLEDYGEESSLVGDEGGYGPKLRAEGHGAERVLEAVLASGMKPGQDVAIGLDIASSHFYQPAIRQYVLARAQERHDSHGMVAMLEHWVNQFPIVSIEDGVAEDDWDGWVALTARLGKRVQLIGDDLFATQSDRLRQGIERRAANAVLIKVNQVGTLTETFEAIQLAKRHGYRTIISARSGETEDATIADLAVATAAGQIKIGSVARSERLAKYNRLLRIEEHLGPSAKYAGRAALGISGS
jgi:enolase